MLIDAIPRSSEPHGDAIGACPDVDAVPPIVRAVPHARNVLQLRAALRETFLELVEPGRGSWPQRKVERVSAGHREPARGSLLSRARAWTPDGAAQQPLQ